MSRKHLIGTSKRITGTSWWYEENVGIAVMVQITREDGTLIRTEQHNISWALLRAALKRRDRKP